ncbi:MAG: class I SAM-dependent methyltransferase [Boseongicola sp.]|nr:class I SAM-dependent methyltransferase [Boseongicola sp.]MDD9977206.1 class I SAM-dependent methyltransferase [Boseongicola sp.]
MLRQFLRSRRKAKRVAADEALDALLKDDHGRFAYLASLEQECADSSLIGLLEDALKLPGDVVECGVFRGASLRRIAKTVGDIAPDRTIFGLDSFEGFPEGGITEEDTQRFRSETRLMGKFKDADDVPDRLSRFGKTFGLKIDLRKGYFENTLPGIADRQFCFLHIDCDTYAGHKEVLEALYDRLTPGATIVLDDYNDEAWPGATKAVDEFLGPLGVEIKQSTAREEPAWYAIKPV